MNRYSRNLLLALVALLCATPAVAGTLDPLSVQLLQGNDARYGTGDAPSRDIRIDVWTDIAEEATLRRGEEFTLNFQANADLYVVIYKIDVDGMVEILWPASRYSDGFVYGNHTYSIPRPGQGARLRVGNVKGVEYVEAIASVYPFDLRALGIDFRFDPDDRAGHGYYVDGDPFLAVNDINYAITGLEEDVDYVVTDWLHLYVEEQVEYARYSCNQCHLDDTGHPTVTAYVDQCTQVEVRVDWGWHRSWYVSFGWYPLYYEPPFYYWDWYWSRPYWYAYYPVPYRWPAYSCYTRPYPVWWWKSSGYWHGDYASRWSDRRTRSVPLYDVARVRSRTTTVSARDGTRRTVVERPVSTRGTGVHDGRRVDRDTLVRNSRPPRQVDGPTSGSSRSRGNGPPTIQDPGRGDTGRGSVRTNRGARERIVSQRPAGDGNGRGPEVRNPGSSRSNESGRRWTQPRVRNERQPSGSGRSGSGRDVSGSRSDPSRRPQVDRTRNSRGSSPTRRNAVDVPSRGRSRSPDPAPRPKVDRSRSGSSGKSKSGAVRPSKPTPRSQPKSKPVPRSRSGSGSSRGRKGGGRG
jgi:hypothetical protein